MLGFSTTTALLSGLLFSTVGHAILIPALVNSVPGTYYTIALLQSKLSYCFFCFFYEIAYTA